MAICINYEKDQSAGHRFVASKSRRVNAARLKQEKESHPQVTGVVLPLDYEHDPNLYQ
jgi:hypothetical protein